MSTPTLRLTSSTSVSTPSATSTSISTPSSTSSTTSPSISPAPVTPSPSRSSSSSTAPTVPLPAHSTKACYAFDDKKDDYKYGEVYCEYQESVKVNGHFEAFTWEKIAGEEDGSDVALSPVGIFCDQLKERKIFITWQPNATPWAPKSPSECYINSQAAEVAGHNVLLRVGRSQAGCKVEDNKCADDYCFKDIDFSTYSQDQCRQHFANAIREKCYGKGFNDNHHDEAGKPNTYGGSFFTDCLMWTIVAGAPNVLPNGTYIGH
jgi:hypothetical protein